MKFVQMHYFLSQNVGGDKRYSVSPVQKLGIMSPHKLGPCGEEADRFAKHHNLVRSENQYKKFPLAHQGSAWDFFFNTKAAETELSKNFEDLYVLQ